MSILLPTLIREITKRTSDVLTRGEITFPQLFILQHLLQKDRCMMRELAELLNVTTSAVTGFVDRGIDAGLLKREHATEDRRVIWVSITAKGKKVAREFLDQRKEIFRHIVEKLEPEERNQYVQTIEKICRLLKQEKEKP
ncbi:MAG: MarR family transcriptional regulator [Candidatus Omnitrophota bacterium]